MRLFVCWNTSATGGHPCGVAHRALVAAGHRPEVVRARGLALLPDMPFNQSAGRRRAKALTGSSKVPVLELDDGTVIADSHAITDWAKANPA